MKKFMNTTIFASLAVAMIVLLSGCGCDRKDGCVGGTCPVVQVEPKDDVKDLVDVVGTDVAAPEAAAMAETAPEVKE